MFSALTGGARTPVRLAAVFVVAVLAASLAQAGVIYVNASAAAGGDGSAWSKAFTSIDEALAKAVSGDELWVAKGTYTPAEQYGFSVLGSVSLYGGFAGTETARTDADPASHPTVLDGALATGQAYNVVVVRQQDTSTLDGFTIQGGMHGVYISSNAKAVVDHCQIVGNTQEPDGVGGGGAGILADGAKEVLVDHCLIAANSAGGEAGMYASNCTAVTIRRSFFALNKAYYTSGALGVVDANVTVENCVFYANSTVVGPGPGVYTTNESQVTVVNCTFYENTGPHGNAVCSFSPAVATVSNCVIGANSAGQREHFYTDAPTQMTVKNCLIPAALTEIFTLHHGEYGTAPADGGGNVIGEATFANSALPTGSDGVVGTADDGLALVAGSAGIDQASASGAPGTDVLGNQRLAGAAVDMGAYEYGAAQQSTASFTMSMATIFDSYSEGSRHSVRLVVEGTHPTPVDVYVAIITPSGAILCCNDWRSFAAVGEITPMLSGWTVAATDENAMVLALPALQAGVYRWLAVAVESGGNVGVQSYWLASDDAVWSYTTE